MNSHAGNWSESLLHRFRGRVDAPPSDTFINNGNNANGQNSNTLSTSSTVTTVELKKASMGGDGRGTLSSGIHHESLPLVHANSAKDRSRIHRQIIRDVRSRWNRLSVKTRYFICILVLPLVVCFIAADIIDAVFPMYGLLPEKNMNESTIPLNVAKTNEFAVVINTYQRPKQLQDAVRHYAERCGPSSGIHTIYIVWAEEGVTPPMPDSFFRDQNARNRAAINVIQVRNSLNSRFLPIPGVHDMAVFMVDDDIRVDCRSLQRGFDAWKSNPSSMVGYYPRLSLIDYSNHGRFHIRAPPTSFIYHSWPIVYWRQKLNFILTKACFLHSQYMSIYSDANHHPIEILNYIDQYFNCEDVAMSLLVANVTKSATNQVTRSSNICGRKCSRQGFVQWNKYRIGPHDATIQVFKDITEMYRHHGWEIPLKHTFSLRQSSWRRHRFWWQSRPSNVFEWFALSNIFK